MPNQSTSRFKSGGEALEQISKDFNDWSAILTERSIQACYALIAANWAVHGTVDAILKNQWAKWSLVVVFVFLGLNLLFSYLIAGTLYRQCYRAEKDLDAWDREYDKSKTTKTAWPYTKTTELMGAALRALKICLTIIATILFLVSLFVEPSNEVTSKKDAIKELKQIGMPAH